MKRIICALLGFVGAFTASPVFAAVSLTNPLGETDVRIIIGRIISGALSVSGSVALIMFIYGGLLWLTSTGNPETINKGKRVMVWAILGIIVITMAYVATDAIFNALLTGSAEGITE